MDRSRPGSKHHLIVSGDGRPLAITLTAADSADVTQLVELVDRVPPVGRYGKFRPRRLYADPQASVSMALANSAEWTQTS